MFTESQRQPKAIPLFVLFSRSQSPKPPTVLGEAFTQVNFESSLSTQTAFPRREL